MKRVIAVAACGFTLTACSSWMPSFDLPSMPSLSGGGSVGATLAIESDPPGAQASTQGGASCVTPCRLNVAANEPFTVNVALNGYVPQSVPVRVVQPDDPRLTSADGGGGPRLDPNPVYVELERAAPPPPAPRKPRPKRPPVAKRTAPPAASVQAPPGDTPSAPTTAAAPPTPPAPPPMQPSNSAAPWPMPR